MRRLAEVTDRRPTRSRCRPQNARCISLEREEICCSEIDMPVGDRTHVFERSEARRQGGAGGYLGVDRFLQLSRVVGHDDTLKSGISPGPSAFETDCHPPCARAALDHWDKSPVAEVATLPMAPAAMTAPQLDC